MLIGQYKSAVNEKGRCALPSKFRSVLGNNVIVAKWYEGCLVIISPKKFGDLIEKITGKTEVLIRSVRDTDRFILGSSYEIVLDDQGRMVIPKQLRDFASIGDEAVFIGLANRIEVWDGRLWLEKEREVAKSAESRLEEIAKVRRNLHEEAKN